MDDGAADQSRPKLLQGSRFVEEDLRAAKADLEETRMKLDEERERHRAQAAELEGLKVEHDRLKDRYGKAVDEAARGSQVQLKELRDTLEQRDGAVRDLQEQLKRVRAQLDTETATAAAAARDLREARDERDEATEQIAELKRRAEAAESDAALAGDKERAVTARRNELEAQVVKLLDEAKATTTAADAQARELADLKSATSDGTKEAAQLREKLRVATERATQAEADLATARAQAEAAATEAEAAAAAHIEELARVRAEAAAAAAASAANTTNAEAAAAAAAAAASAAATIDAVKADLEEAHRAIASQEARATEAAAAAKTLETTVAGLKEQRAQDFSKIQEIVKNADAAKATVEARATQLASDLDRVVAENAVLKTKLAAVVVSPIATDTTTAGSPVFNAQISQLRDDNAQLQREYDAKMELVRKQHAALTSSLFDCGLRNLQLQVMSRRATWGGVVGTALAGDVDDGEATAGAYADVGPGQPLTYLEWQRRNFTTGALDLLAKAARTSVGSR
jgi:chromosome segregation ATPase